ncbi:MAG: alpha/beta hydrolase [Bacteroidales bacterium]|nr:alpha/beta hydrolase [Bacteroidales bacterium]
MLGAVGAAKTNQGFRINLWEKGAPHKNGNPQDTAWVQVFLPDARRSCGKAIVICPGGGYSHLAMNHEGLDWAPFFNNMGIAAVVLHYRMPNGNHKVPLEDAEAAIQLVRANAKSWNINPDAVGIMGSSAGGHLASTIATHSTGASLPDFQVLFYPVITMDPGFSHKGSHDNFLGKNARKKDEQLFSNDMQVTRKTPRAWVALSDDDTVVPAANGFNYYFECYRHDVPASLHVYPTGGHGWGIRPSFQFHAEMLQELKAWLMSF